MLIDLILDRKGGAEFDPVDFGFSVLEYAAVFDCVLPVLRAFNSGCEQRLKYALCGYILDEGYNPELCDYVNSVVWLPAWWDM